MRPMLKPIALALTIGLLLLTLGVTLAPAADKEPDPQARWLKIRVYHGDSETPNVLVNLPLGAVSALVRLASRSGVLDRHIDICLMKARVESI